MLVLVAGVDPPGLVLVRIEGRHAPALVRIEGRHDYVLVRRVRSLGVLHTKRRSLR